MPYTHNLKMYTVPLTELGRKRLNPLAQSTNLWKLTTDLCECTQDATCVDYAEIDIDPARTIASVTFSDGTVVAVTPTATSDLPALKEAIETALLPYENLPYVEILVSDTDALIVLKHYGANTISSIQWATGGDTNMTRNCVIEQLCSFSGQKVGAVTPITLTLFDDTQPTVAVAGGPYAWVGTPATDDATAAAFILAVYTALEAAGYVGVDAHPVTGGTYAMTAARNDTDETFDLVIPRVRGVKALSITGDAFTKTGCVDDFAHFTA